MNNYNAYLYRFSHLNRGITKYGKAPHKPVLLLSLLELIDKGYILDNQVFVDDELVGTFLENWGILVDTPHQADFTQPFYYLQSERVDGQPIWELCAKPGYQINAHISSVNTLIQVLNYGRFTDELYHLLLDQTIRSQFIALLLVTYFPTQSKRYYQMKAEGEGYLQEVSQYILNEPEVRVMPARTVTEEEHYVRNALFKKFVPKLYDHTCSITGMRLGNTFGHQFIDACHIVPFSVTQNDKVSNGIALCPNLHRVFDRGLITIDQDYCVVASVHINELTDHAYSLKPFHGQKMRLPANHQYWPALENLAWHQEHIFKG